MKKTLLYFLIFVAVQLGIGGIASVIMSLWFPKVSPTNPTAMIIITAVCSLLLIGMFLWFKWCPVSRNYIRTRPWATLAWTVLLAIGIVIPLTWLMEQIPQSWMPNLMENELKGMMSTSEGYFVVCMLAPLMEEVIFRGAIIRALSEWFAKRWGNAPVLNELSKAEWTAIILSAVIFGIAHFNPAQIPYALIVGILLGWLFVKTGSIVPGFLIHWINNSAAYVAVKLFPTLPTDARLADYFGSSSTVLRAVVCSLMIALPALYQLVKVRRSSIQS